MIAVKDVVLRLFAERGVDIEEIGRIVYELQRPYSNSISLEQCVESVLRVIEKREAQHAIITGIALDMLAEQNALPEPLNSIVRRDEPLYGVDEVLALAVTNIYGSVGLTSFGYLDKLKLGLIGRLNDKDKGRVNTFLDDLVAGVAAAAAARIAHQRVGDVVDNGAATGHSADAGEAGPQPELREAASG
ncbi:MAG: phosphatidylglycerophosphatase A [Firmicutes bacterium ZCTH02-B6]|nr:MAG: phosphatidylglycerophosphatase A [Firmicutes bacterium ZCTH02-B6]